MFTILKTFIGCFVQVFLQVFDKLLHVSHSHLARVKTLHSYFLLINLIGIYLKTKFYMSMLTVN